MEKAEDADRKKTLRIYTVSLSGMTFEACHGCLQEEKMNPNTFRVDFEGCLASSCAQGDNLNETVNYAAVYDCIRKVMEGPSRNLLETLSSEIIDQVRKNIPEYEDIKVCVSKKNPPLGGQCEWARAEEHWSADSRKKRMTDGH